jgi:pimeloyl-ACP methyl ester carboxylesterase
MPGLFSETMPSDRAHELTTVMSEIRPAGTLAMAHALAESDLRDLLGQITVPTLLVHGDSDERSPLAVANDLNARIPGSTLTVLPGLGHECYLEDPTAFKQAVNAFLRLH